MRRECQFVIHAHFELRVGQTQVFPMLDAQHARGCRCFPAANLNRAACPHFAFGKIEDSDAVSAAYHLDQRAAASQLHIVGMSGYGEQVEFHRASAKQGSRA